MNLSAKYLQNNCDFHGYKHIKNTSYIYKIDKKALDDFGIQNEISLFIAKLTEEEQIAVAVTNMNPLLPMPPNNTKRVKFKINNRTKGLPSLI